MRNKKPDKKNISLAKTIYELRQAIDIHRVVGLNSKVLRDKPGHSYFALTQGFAIQVITLNVCKIYEYQKGYPLNSISGIIKSLPDRKCQRAVMREVERFCAKYGERRKSNRCVVMLRRTLLRFKNAHRRSLRQFKVYRDKHVAHSEYPVRRRSLPSHDEFEAIHQFAQEFYKLISNSFINVGPASVGRHAEVCLTILLKAVGVVDPVVDF